MKISVLIIGILLLSCKNKISNDSEISFEIQNKTLYNNNILKMKIINKSNNDYFFCLDTTSIYYNTGLNYKMNEFIHPKPIFYCNDKVIDIGYPLSNMIKPMSLDTAHYNCIKRNIQYRQELLDHLRKLKKIIVLKKYTSLILKLPFNNTNIWCNRYYTYIREKGSFKIQFKYKMNMDYLDEIIDHKLLLEFQQKKIKPYYKEIVSNKIQFILK
jgi:hypothetical protein